MKDSMMMSNDGDNTKSSASVGSCRQMVTLPDQSKVAVARLNRRRRLELRKMKDLSQGNSVVEDPCMEKPKNTKIILQTSAGEASQVNFSSQCVSVIGRRRELEDTVSVEVGFVDKPSKKYDFYGVYDGHGGSKVADACRERLHEILAEEIAESPEEINWEQTMLKSFEKMDVEVSETEPVVSVGSTAIVAVVSNHEVVIGNCGDSRAVLFSGGRTFPLSDDHKPDRPDELARIENAGGRVVNWNGLRVSGVLATSRSIGDQQLKPYVIAMPEVTVHKRSDDDEFLILATDGLWDVVSNDGACDLVKKCIEGRIVRRKPVGVGEDDESCLERVTDAAVLLAEMAVAHGSSDNISVVVVNLNKASNKSA